MPKDFPFADAWYRNNSVAADGSPAPLDVGYCVFKPGQARFFTARERGAAGDPFEAAMKNRRLLGPFATEAAAGGAAPAVSVSMSLAEAAALYLASGERVFVATKDSDTAEKVARESVLKLGFDVEEVIGEVRRTQTAARLEVELAEAEARAAAEAAEKAAADAAAAEAAAKAEAAAMTEVVAEVTEAVAEVKATASMFDDEDTPPAKNTGNSGGGKKKGK